jgi:hypothetical protein
MDKVELKEMSIKIPANLKAEFRDEMRVVVKHPWMIGIPAIDKMIMDKVFMENMKKDYDLMFVPKSK